LRDFFNSLLAPNFPDDEPWTLVVEDLSKPAFMQPPIPEGTWKALPKVLTHAGDLDVLVTSRNHGVKTDCMAAPFVDGWVMGLLALQTFSGFLGQGNYGVARQNGGFASRPGVEFVSGDSPGWRWARDCRVILDHRDDFADSLLEYDEHGLALLWLPSWNGEESLRLDRLHPLFIEISRRVRLKNSAEGLIVRRQNTKTSRVEADQYKGNLMDPWTPIQRADGKAYNLRPAYAVAWRVLFEDENYERPLLLHLHPPDRGRPLAALFRFFARGQGKSDGYHERLIPIPAPMISFALGARRDAAAETAKAMTEAASTAQFKIFKPALMAAMQAAREQIEYKQPETNEWANRLTRRLDEDIDHAFFPRLWECLAVFDESGDHSLALEPWRDFLKRLLRNNLQTALNSIPLPSSLAYKARALAEAVLEATIRKHFSTTEQP